MKRSVKLPDRLTAKQERLLQALLSEPTQERAAEVAQVSVTTLWRSLRDPVFQAAYRKARQQLIESAAVQLQKASGEAVETLKRLMGCGHPGTEARAAVAILEQGFRASELIDLAARLEALEQAGKERDDAEHGRTKNAG